MYRERKKVILVGTNPSKSSPTNTPFDPLTKSGSKVRSWFKHLDVELVTANVMDEPTPNNRQLKTSEIRDSLPKLKDKVDGHSIVVAVGSTASKALKTIGVDHFEMWHPSGLCRKWNDVEATSRKMEELHRYIDER